MIRRRGAARRRVGFCNQDHTRVSTSYGFGPIASKPNFDLRFWFRLAFGAAYHSGAEVLGRGRSRQYFIRDMFVSLAAPIQMDGVTNGRTSTFHME